MPSYAKNLTEFYTTLSLPTGLPPGIEVLYPFSDPLVRKIVQAFFDKYYPDDHPRHLILGINPGRFGAGTTGINFTAPRELKKYLEIDHPFKDQSELSAEFIYEMIDRYGGPREF